MHAEWQVVEGRIMVVERLNRMIGIDPAESLTSIVTPPLRATRTTLSAGT